MSRPWGRAVLAVVVAVVWLGSPAAADAHLRSGTVAVDYQASVTSAPSDAYTAQIFASDRALSLRVRAGHTVVLLGYLGEPVFRLDAGRAVGQRGVADGHGSAARRQRATQRYRGSDLEASPPGSTR